MSRGFIKEDDQEEIPIVPPRADLPEGVTNYVTPMGMKALLEEKQHLLEEISNLDTSNESERRIAVNHINAKLQLLTNRIVTAKTIALKEQPQDEIRFGAKVILRVMATNKIQKFQIVGVDEADILHGKISFISPLAKILIRKRVGDQAVLRLAKEDRVFEIMDINYE
ncbi:transcription elongation factor GreB [Arenibacter nanhaiticus]|uniref:Transcription elongation factor GreB n=1 Tax=Arenibacter nanhaiticus TaxID=558155 RepID=A0A1M6KNR1_9FLAO|nr:GreA/GreB family elongation factor [Arenibacter nanhaiticus]SHJ60633.1 transcription elongation factor GreB [Arenibacter nanhaiticus]